MAQDIPASPTHFAVFDGDLSPEWFAHYKNAKALAVDTEAMGLIHGRDRLCLVQICDDQDRVCCIRIARGQSEAPLLKELMPAWHRWLKDTESTSAAPQKVTAEVLSR